MRIRLKRLLMGCCLLLLAAVFILASLEWNRRRHVAAAGNEHIDGSGAVVSARDLEERYSNADSLNKLCADVREHCDRIKVRYLRLRHKRKTRMIRYDDKDQPTAIAEMSYRVQYRNGSEQKEEIERRQVLGKSSFFDPDRVKIAQEDTQIAGPFSNDSPEGLYRYHLESVEELQGRRLLRIHFEPVSPEERSFKGSAWIDPDTHEPVRMKGSLAKLPLGCDRFDMLLDYGASENGHIQLRRVVMDMAGGFALVSLHYRIDSELSEYRERGE